MPNPPPADHQASARERFRQAVLVGGAPSPWADHAAQAATLGMLLNRVRHARAAGRRALIGMDLDLTSLLAPAKSVEVLAGLAPRAGEVAGHLTDIDVAQADRLVAALGRCWRGEQAFLVPGYTTTAIEGYAVYLAAVLTTAEGIVLKAADRDRLEAWINDTVFRVLRNGYWARDLMADLIAPGFAAFVAAVYAAGGEIVFLSNRSPDTRVASMARLCQALAEAGLPETALFICFGPGGSAYDAASKQQAVALLEAGAPAGAYLGEIVDNRLVYPPFQPDWTAGSVLVGMVDDRAENRQQVAAAAAASALFWAGAGQGGVAEVAVAAPGFSTEIATVDAPDRISSFSL